MILGRDAWKKNDPPPSERFQFPFRCSRSTARSADEDGGRGGWPGFPETVSQILCLLRGLADRRIVKHIFEKLVSSNAAWRRTRGGLENDLRRFLS